MIIQEYNTPYCKLGEQSSDDLYLYLDETSFVVGLNIFKEFNLNDRVRIPYVDLYDISITTDDAVFYLNDDELSKLPMNRFYINFYYWITVMVDGVPKEHMKHFSVCIGTSLSFDTWDEIKKQIYYIKTAKIWASIEVKRELGQKFEKLLESCSKEVNFDNILTMHRQGIICQPVMGDKEPDDKFIYYSDIKSCAIFDIQRNGDIYHYIEIKYLSKGTDKLYRIFLGINLPQSALDLIEMELRCITHTVAKYGTIK